MRFRQRPVIVEAWQNLKGNPYPDYLVGKGLGVVGGTMMIPSGDALIELPAGHWLIKDCGGVIHTCDPKMFTLAYERDDPGADREDAAEYLHHFDDRFPKAR